MITSKFKTLSSLIFLVIIITLACHTPKQPVAAKTPQPPARPAITSVKDSTVKKRTSFSANSVYIKKPHRSEPAPKEDYTRPGYNSAAPAGPHIQKASSKP